MMSYCHAQQDYGIPCSNRNKCRRKYQNVNVNEVPERDIPKCKYTPKNLPPEPPDDGDWELQYCKWSGWTWVKKVNKDGTFQSSHPISQPSEEPVATQQQHQQPENGKKPKGKQDPKRQKKSGGLFSCFKKKEAKPTVTASAQVSGVTLEDPLTQSTKKQAKNSNFGYFGQPSGIDYGSCFCCNCNQMCCPCMLQNRCCCCCCSEESEEPERTSLKAMETQTSCREVREQATKTSEIHVPRQGLSLKKRRCMCRPVCCPCMRNYCCPCVQSVCCPCKPVNENSNCPKETKDAHPIRKVHSDIINYCLPGNFLKQNKPDFLNLKTSSFSTLHKSLDLLLKNNINIMTLFDNKKELSSQPVSCFNSNHTIFSLSPDNLVKRSDAEHSKLLTAVCDALLSSHKFDKDKLSPVVQPMKLPSTKSSRGNCEAKDSQNSFSIFANGGLIGKILSDANFPTLTKNDSQPESSKKPDVFLSRKSSTKLVRNKSRILSAPRFPNRAEALRKYIDFMRSGYDKNSKKVNKKPDKKLKIKDKPVLTEVFKNTNLHENHLVKLETIDNMLNSTNFVSGSSTKTNSDEQNFPSSENAPPLITDLGDLLLSLDDSKRDVKEK